MTGPTPVDLDRGGNAFQRVNTYLGPSLGWVTTRVKPELFITAAGAYTLTPDTGIAFVNVAASVTFTLPSVVQWVTETAYNPATAFERAIWVKDLGGHATAFPISIFPAAGQFIDLQTSAVITTNFALVRLYPLADLTGWFVG